MLPALNYIASHNAALDEENKELKRAQSREGVDVTYLKNLILKMLLDEEMEFQMFNVISHILKMSQEEIELVNAKKKKKWKR